MNISMNIKNSLVIIFTAVSLLASCSSETQFLEWRTEHFDQTQITKSVTKSFVFANSSSDGEQHIRAIAFDKGSNAVGHFKINSVKVGAMDVEPTDIVVPPGSSLSVEITYSPRNLETTKASWGGWTTGNEERWIPKRIEDLEEESQNESSVIHRSLVIAVYDYPKEGYYYLQLVGEAEEGPNGEVELGGGATSCEPGGGTACYNGGFAIDIPQLAPGGPKPMEVTGPVTFNVSGGSAKLRMDDFPNAIYYLRSEEVTQLPSGTTVTLVVSGTEGVEAEGTFDGSRITLSGVSFRIRAALGELSSEQVKQGMAALIDFDVPDLTIETISPLSQGSITMRMETSLPQNPSGNDLFDQFLSGANVVAIMEGELDF